MGIPSPNQTRGHLSLPPRNQLGDVQPHAPGRRPHPQRNNLCCCHGTNQDTTRAASDRLRSFGHSYLPRGRPNPFAETPRSTTNKGRLTCSRQRLGQQSTFGNTVTFPGSGHIFPNTSLVTSTRKSVPLVPNYYYHHLYLYHSPATWFHTTLSTLSLVSQESLKRPS